MSFAILIVQTYYPEFLKDRYTADPGLALRSYDAQIGHLLESGFGVGDAYSHYLRELGCDTAEVICNADVAQARWATEHGIAPAGNIHDRRRQIVAAQVGHYRPDVLFVFEWSPLGDTFLAEMRGRVRLLVGQIASSLAADRTFAAYHTLISSWPPIVDHFRAKGGDAAPLRLGFDPRILERLGSIAQPQAVTFVGGLAPVHQDRIHWLEALLKEIDIHVYGYGVERLEQSSAIRRHWHGQVWGLRMCEVISNSHITLNLHGDISIDGKIAAAWANNMRLYESTGVGACLVTDWRENLSQLFEPEREVVTFLDTRDCVEKVRYYLAHDDLRRSIARAGQARTLREHTYAHRMRELFEILRKRL